MINGDNGLRVRDGFMLKAVKANPSENSICAMSDWYGASTNKFVVGVDSLNAHNEHSLSGTVCFLFYSLGSRLCY